jgi:hypothetical protein
MFMQRRVAPYAAGAAYPEILSYSSGVRTTDGTTTDIELPSGVASGNFLVLVFAKDSIADPTTPDGWTELFSVAENEGGGNSNYMNLAVYYKTAGGSESNFSVTHLSERTCWCCLRTNGTSLAFELQTPSSSNQHPDPPSLTDPLGSDTYLWLAVGAWDVGGQSLSGGDADYTELVQLDSTGTSGNGLVIAYREHTAATDDPDAWTLSSSRRCRAATLTVRP